MKTKIPLSISANYVSSWTAADAIREILQNAIDQQVVNSENTWSVNYSDNKLTISSKLSNLDRSSLILGSSTKIDDERTIGKYGEGYKLALLVLTRLGFKVEILNYFSKEKWTPYIAASKQFSDSKILYISVEKYVFKSVPDQNLTFVINGVTQDLFELVVSNTLQLQEYDKYRIHDSEILFDEKHKSKIFVNGLFVDKVAGLEFGYNLSTKKIDLGRDRKLVRDFDVQWASSELWSKTVGTDHEDKLAELLRNDCKDVEYVSSMYNTTLPDVMFSKFQDDHGTTSVPVVSNSQFDSARKYGNNPVMVPKSYFSVLSSSSKYTTLVAPRSLGVVASPYTKLQELFNNHESSMSDELKNDFNEILEQSRNWTIGNY